jgi:hypothetical protein
MPLLKLLKLTTGTLKFNSYLQQALFVHVKPISPLNLYVLLCKFSFSLQFRLLLVLFVWNPGFSDMLMVSREFHWACDISV